jgi:hypothetical protein
MGPPTQPCKLSQGPGNFRTLWWGPLSSGPGLLVLPSEPTDIFPLHWEDSTCIFPMNVLSFLEWNHFARLELRAWHLDSVSCWCWERSTDTLGPCFHLFPVFHANRGGVYGRGWLHEHLKALSSSRRYPRSLRRASVVVP